MYLAQNDEDFFPQPADEMLSNHKFNAKIPLMLGGVAGEYDFLLGRKRIPGYETGRFICFTLTLPLAVNMWLPLAPVTLASVGDAFMLDFFFR